MKRIMSFLLAMVLFGGLVLTGAPTVHAASDMKASAEMVAIMKQEEGFSAKPYPDHGQYTVGYGTRCPDDMLEEYMANGITEEAAELLLRNYLLKIENTINKKFIDKYNLSLTQGQFDALVSFTYNCGTSWISETGGTFHNAVKNGKTGSELINAFSLWCSAGGQILPGLVRRRLSEANMFLNETYSRTIPGNFCYVYYNANGGSVSYRIQGFDANEGIGPAYTPTYKGHTFLGWYTAKTGGSKVTVLNQNHNGDTLYARWDDANEETTATPTDGVSVTVTATDVNLRKGPGTNYGIVGTARKGDKMVITETASGSGYEWGNADGKWIALKFTNYSEAIKETEPTEPETTEPAEPETTAPAEPETTEPTVPETTEPAPTEPETKKVTGTVKASGGLSVRSGPGTSYARVKYIYSGTKVTILEQKKVGSMTWGKISSGWISMDYVVLDKTETKPTEPETTEPTPTEPEPTEPAPTEPETKKVTGTVKANGGLSVRSGPGTGYSRVKFIYSGTKVTILEQKKVGSMTWGKISAGWISMDYVVLDKTETKPTEPAPTEPAPTEPETTEPAPTEPETTEPAPTEPEKTKLTGTVKANGGLSVRKGAGTSYAVKRYIYSGTKVTITKVQEVKGSKWGKISDGWICMDYVVLDEQKNESSSNIKTVTADCLNVRESASTSARIVGYYYQGARVEILETKDVDGITWGKTSKGWISMAYVK